MKTSLFILAALVLAGSALAETEVVLDPRSGAKDIPGVMSKIEESWTNIDRMGYEFCLADTFSFTPHLSLAREFPDLDLSGWDRQAEMDLALRIFIQASRLQIKLPSRIKDRGEPSRNAETWIMGYAIQVQGTVYAGDAALDFVRINKKWYLAGWTDVAETILEGQRSPTSGVMRAKFRRTK